MLQNLHLEGQQRSKRVKEAFWKFIAARQLSGHPVAVLHHKVQLRQSQRELEREIEDEVSDR